MTTSILFVCLGNICRSPSAEGVVRAKAAARGMDLELDSAGTGDWHVGDSPYGPMQEAARARGYDLSSLRARQAVAADFHRFDMVIAMDPQNHADLEAIRPEEGGAELFLFTDLLEEPGITKVPDPYHTRDFDGALDLVERCAEALLDRLDGADR